MITITTIIIIELLKDSAVY